MNIFLLIAGMAVVTYIPRALPAVILDKLKFGKRMQKFLSLIPYTAMAALIFPGVLGVDATHMYIGAAGGLVALILSWRKAPVMLVIAAAVLCDMLLYMLL